MRIRAAIRPGAFYLVWWLLALIPWSSGAAFAAGSTDGGEEVVLAVEVNGQESGRDLVVLRDADGGCWLEAADFRCLNAEWQLSLSGCRNHARPGALDLFTEIARIAPGSYGVMFIRDDEDADTPEQWWQCVMARGQVRRHGDGLISPHRPTVEDFEPWETGHDDTNAGS